MEDYKMKKAYKYILLAFAVMGGLSSCSLDVDNNDNVNTTDAFKTLTDVRNGMNGAYYYLGQYEFLGNYALAIGDMSGGVCAGSSSSGHFINFSDWTISDTEGELSDVWNYGYKVIDASTRTIAGGKALLANTNANLKKVQTGDLYAYIGECYALKALAYHYLVNLFALPYSSANKSAAGLVLVKDTPIDAFEKVQRSTVEETYAQILSDLSAAENAYKEAQAIYDEVAQDNINPGVNLSSAYYMGYMGLKSLEARVYMSMGNYTDAEAAAKEAISLKNTGDGTASDTNPSNEGYVTMWKNTAVTAEDLFTIVKSDNDNLSANALNTLYGSYYGTVQIAALKTFKTKTDIRFKGLVTYNSKCGYQPLKFNGTATAQAVSNIPIFRKSEMSLIIAECEARAGNIAEAQNYVMYTAKRNTALTAADLPTTAADMLTFISQERIREFFGEGHRFYDARRMGDLVNADNFAGFDIQKFVFPIPSDEINSGFGVAQNTGWEDNLPATE